MIKEKHIAVATAAVGVALAFGGLATATTAGAATTTPKAGATAPCLANRDDEWPDWVNGQPAGFEAGANGGVYLWHDTSGWHLRVTHKTDDRVSFGGTIVTRGMFSDVEGVMLERGDQFEVSPDHHAITFRFMNYGHIDGLDFRTHCAPALEFSFQADGHQLPANRAVIGHEDRHPDTDPFPVWRTR
jgi:hypothetical protein